MSDKPGVLPGRDGSAATTTAGEEELSWLLTCGPDVVINRLTGLLGQLEPDGSARLLLSHRHTLDGVPVRSNVLDLQTDHVATAQLGVDSQVEHTQIARSALDLELSPDRPDVFWA